MKLIAKGLFCLGEAHDDEDDETEDDEQAYLGEEHGEECADGRLEAAVVLADLAARPVAATGPDLVEVLVGKSGHASGDDAHHCEDDADDGPPAGSDAGNKHLVCL